MKRQSMVMCAFLCSVLVAFVTGCPFDSAIDAGISGGVEDFVGGVVQNILGNTGLIQP